MSELALQLIRKEKEEKTGKLDLGNCGLRDEWPKELFELEWLEELNLSDHWWDWEKRKVRLSHNRGYKNYLSTIPDDIIKLNNLKALIAGRTSGFNWERNAHDVFQNLNCLQYLDISNTRINDYSFLEKLPNLKFLNLSYNIIKDAKSLEKLTQLKALEVSSILTSDPNFLDRLPILESLGFNNNQIESTRWLDKQSEIRFLSLRENKVRNISFLEKLPLLQYLDISYNQINDISCLDKLPLLQHLNISYNHLKDINWLEQLTQLQSLMLISNKINDYSFLENLSKLQHLNLSYNQISDIRWIRKLVLLQELDLSNNKIEDIHWIKELIQLRSLNLRANKIDNIDCLEHLPLLNYLNINDNCISDISPIKSLILKNVPIIVTPNEVGISLDNNPLTTPPSEIVGQGSEAILNYFKLLESDGEDYLFEAKLLILGESGAGKTSFARKIQNNIAILPEEEETTRGIEVAFWKYELTHSEVLASAKGTNQFSDKGTVEKALQKGFHANLWDFGGQEIYHSTHRFFLSHRSLYVLLANARNQDTDFNYWMNIAEQLGGDSPLLVVINEKQGHRWRIDETGLKGRFSFFRELLEVNFGDETDIGRLERLRNSVKKHLRELPHIGDKLPKSWVEIRRALQEENKPYISFDRYFEICHANNMSELDQVLQLSQYFHDIGVFLHFQYDPVLKNRIFLDANWATGTVYKLLNDQQVKNNKGRFTLIDAKSIWPNEQLIHDELLKLLERFNLAYRIENTHQFIAPEHLPELKPYAQWEHQDNLLMLRYEFDAFMPRGLITELIVALHRYIPDQERVWRKGVVLQREEAWAEIIEAYGNVFRIEIKVAKKDKKEFLTIISEALDKTLNRFANLRYEKLVPCNCKLCGKSNNKSFYKLSDLKRRLSNGRDTIDCPINQDIPTPIWPMLQETFIFSKDYNIRSKLAEGNIHEALALLEHRSGMQNEAIQLRSQLSSLQAEYDKGKITFELYQLMKARVTDATLNLDKQED